MASTSAQTPSTESLQLDPEQMATRLERVGGRLMELARTGAGKKLEKPLAECVQELRLVWSQLRELALVFDANRVETMLAHEEELRRAMEILNGTVGTLSRANERAVETVDRQLHELDEIDAIGDASLMAERLRTVSGNVRAAATEMRDDIERSATQLDQSEQIIKAVDQKLQEAKKQVMYDSLTRVLSRAVFEQRLREMASQSTAVTGAWCLAIVDIDNLSVTNERLGRRVGDALLFRIADIIQTTSDTLPGSIVGRWGGEEFAILMPRTSLLQGRQLAEEIRGAVNLAKWECRASAQPVVVTTTVSVGVVQHRNGESATELLARALECVARAKRRGRNCVVSEA